MKVEFAIAGSPNDAFFSQMAMFRLALSDLGGTYKAARVICVFGDSEVQPIPERWREAFKDIEPMQPGGVLATAANTAALEEWVGFKPSTPIETGVQRFAAWYRSFYGV